MHRCVWRLVPRVPLLSAVSGSVPSTSVRASSALRPDLNFDYLLDDKNADKIRKNCAERKGVGSIDAVRAKWSAIETVMESRMSKAMSGQAGGPAVEQKEEAEMSEAEYEQLWNELYEEAVLIPNESRPDVPRGGEDKAVVLGTFGEKREGGKLQPAEKVVHSWRALLHPTEAAGQRSYALLGPLADLERALLSHAWDSAVAAGFRPVVVPDLVSRRVTEACGVQQRSAAHMQYILNDGTLETALSGTAEMGIAALLEGRTFSQQQLPVRLVAESRCYRPEISKSAHEARLYRVHEFTKVEMFVVCTPEQSDSELERLRDTQRTMFEQLGVHARVLLMPSEELGAPAAKKYDIEAWMPGRGVWGEVSSASNCTDFQARRLNIKYVDSQGVKRHAHTCNGTALASTRALIALLESHQTARGGLSDLPPAIKSRMPEKRRPALKMQTAPALV